MQNNSKRFNPLLTRGIGDIGRYHRHISLLLHSAFSF
jgi:hypothetical protein